jgi:hypothetical protein
MDKRMLFMTALAVTGIVTGAMATSLTMIPPTGADTTSSGRTIVWGGGGGGAIVVGQSGTGTGIIWDASLGSRAVVSSDGAGATVLTGLGYRRTPGGRQLVAHGMTGSGHNLYSSMDHGVTWGVKNRLTNTYDNPFTIATSNTLGVSSVLDADGTNKAYFGFAWNQAHATSKQLAITTAADGITAPDYKSTLTVVSASTTSNSSAVNGVASTGLGVGYRNPNAYWVTAAGTKGTLSTLNGTAGEAWAISADAMKVFGRSTVTDGRTGTYPFMNTGLVPGTNPGAAVELPGLPGASGYTSNGLAYGASADGKYAVGMSYPGVEKAVLWDTQAMTILDLTAHLDGLGLLDGFTRLSRAYSVFDAGNGFTLITGQGVWSPDGGVTTYTRGFVAMVPEPSTLALLVLGLPLLRRRR